MVSKVSLLATIVHTQLHAAHTAFTHAMTSKWSYLCRTLKNISSSLLPLEQSIRTKLIPALTGRQPPNNTERELLHWQTKLVLQTLNSSPQLG